MEQQLNSQTENQMKNRIKETAEKIISNLPPQNRLMITALYPQFLRLLDNMPDDDILSFISTIENHLSYIKGEVNEL